MRQMRHISVMRIKHTPMSLFLGIVGSRGRSNRASLAQPSSSQRALLCPGPCCRGSRRARVSLGVVEPVGEPGARTLGVTPELRFLGIL